MQTKGAKGNNIGITYPETIREIHKLCSTTNNFTQKIEKLTNLIGKWDIQKLSYHLENVGSIPEMFKHDSSEEKLYAKYCDYLVFGFFELVGMKSELCKERGDYADVIGETKEYKIVADAKSFRLSRTALNPKDYKIEALNGWRKRAKADFACLVAPINEFPKGRSRLYRESVGYNVIMLSYTHLLFILSVEDPHKLNLKPLWEIYNSIQNPANITAEDYWKKIEGAMLLVLKKSNKDWKSFEYNSKIRVLANIQLEIDFLEKEVELIKKMEEGKVRELLLEKIGIKNKLAQIMKKKRFLEEGLPH